MKATTSVFAFLAIAGLTATGIVLAQAQNNNASTSRIGETQSQATSVDEAEHPVLGKVLFEDVTSVHYAGVEFPANSDGSFGGWVAKNEGAVREKMTIYENFIVKDAIFQDGTVFREIRPYDRLGNIEQRIPAGAPEPVNSN